MVVYFSIHHAYLKLTELHMPVAIAPLKVSEGHRFDQNIVQFIRGGVPATELYRIHITLNKPTPFQKPDVYRE